MTVELADRFDLTLDAFRRVAWGGEDVRLGAGVADRVAGARTAFMALVEDGSTTIYGVTSGFGDRARNRLTAEERVRQARSAADRGVSFGEPLPERVARGIVLARLANMLGGHAAVRPELVAAVADQLDGRPLPPVPSQGYGGSGEIVALGHLLGDVALEIALAEKEGLALVNGSPCAAALIADGALAARGRLALGYDAFALSVEALSAPLEAYDEALIELWGDEEEGVALRELGARLSGADQNRAPHQAPVSYRILPRALGQGERATRAAEHAATVSLSSVTDNPVFVPPSAPGARGRVLSTGGYHNAASSPALDGLAAIWANLARLAERHVEQLWVGPGKRQAQPVEELLSLLLMVVSGYGEEAAAHARPTLLARSGPGQNDVGSPSFLAWRQNEASGAALDACLAILLVSATQILLAEGRVPSPPLRRRFEQVAGLSFGDGTPGGDRIGRLLAALATEIYPA